MLEDTTNPSAPKVPRRDNLAASDTNGQICQDWYSFSWGGAMFARASRQKVHVTAVIRAFCRSAENRPNGPFRSNMAATLPRPGVNFGQQGPNYGPTWSNWSNFGPAWIQDGATSLQLGSIWEQLLPTPTWCEAVAKGAKLRHVRIDLDFHVHHMASIWNLDRFGPDFTPT